MNKKLINVKKALRSFKTICLALSTLITLQATRFTTTTADKLGTAKFLTSNTAAANDIFKGTSLDSEAQLVKLDPSVSSKTILTATCGQSPRDIKNQLPIPQTSEITRIEGKASWNNGNNTSVEGKVITNLSAATFTPASLKNYKTINNAPVSVTVSVDKSNWGKKVKNNGVTNYVADDGTTSVEVVRYGTIWLKEESGGTSTWYGIDNSNGIFKLGSRFHVRWLSKEDDTSEWEMYYSQVDNEHKVLVNEGRILIFLIGVTDPDGNEYKNFGAILPLYIQLDKDWDENDLKAIYIASGEDEIVSASIIENMEFPEGTGKFGKLELRHFSPYAVYDSGYSARKNILSQPGDVVTYVIVIGLVSLIIASGGVLFITRNNKKSYEK